MFTNECEIFDHDQDMRNVQGATVYANARWSSADKTLAWMHSAQDHAYTSEYRLLELVELQAELLDYFILK